MELKELCDMLYDWCVTNEKEYVDICFINNGINHCVDDGKERVSGRYLYDKALKGFISSEKPYIEVGRTRVDWHKMSRSEMEEDDLVKAYAKALGVGIRPLVKDLWFADFILSHLPEASAVINEKGLTICIDELNAELYIRGAAEALDITRDYDIVSYETLKAQSWYRP